MRGSRTWLIWPIMLGVPFGILIVTRPMWALVWALFVIAPRYAYLGWRCMETSRRAAIPYFARRIARQERRNGRTSG